jgi:hypothetical protein
VIRSSIVYLDKPDPDSTLKVIEAIKPRLTAGDVIGIIVPVTSGRTAEQFTEDFQDEKIITVSETQALSFCVNRAQTEGGILRSMVNNRIKRVDKLIEKRLNREVFDLALLPFCGEEWEAAKEVLYSFGQGMKVAIEVSVAAVELGKAPQLSKAIAVGGNEGRVDTAVVIRTPSKGEAFAKSYDRRLIIEEIICMPIQKK